MSNNPEYEMPETGLGLPMPAEYVANAIVVYVKGHGQSLRVTATPGSDPEAFEADTEELELCNCVGAGVWTFIFVDPEIPRVDHFVTVDAHIAIAIMGSPSKAQEQLSQGMDLDLEAVMAGEMHLVPPEDGLATVLVELDSWLSENNSEYAAELPEDAIRFSELHDNDIVEEFNSLLEETGEGDD